MPDLPGGTITFLFTDVEGSTKLWEHHPEAIRKALVRHEALASSVIAQHGGTLVRSRGEGDSLFIVFTCPIEAVAAVCALQKALHAESWPENAPLRVRMALHTGEADLRDGDYYGSTVNRCARLRAIGHGGQTLLSQATSLLVRDHLPEGAELRDMFSHRLKDLQQPEHVWQLLLPDLPADFPPLRSLQAFANNLPVQTTSFIGRAQEMEEVKRRLARVPLLTLAGIGGCGKTRLSLQVAADLLEDFPDGVWLVELAPLTDPAFVPYALATALGLREEPNRPLLQTLIDDLMPKTALLLLDNCEHLIEASARLADTLLRACPKVKLLATSRETLNIPGETVWRVPSLLQPETVSLPGTEKEAVAALAGYDAVRLFVERARLVRSDFALDGRNGPMVAQVCRRLDGIPLAIELAAARARSLTVEQLSQRLDDRFGLLTGGNRAALPRQQTLRALIDWSYDLLNDSEKTLLRRLSAFAGGWTLEAAEAVCAEPNPPTPFPGRSPNPPTPFPNALTAFAGKGEKSGLDSPFPVSGANEAGKGAGGLGIEAWQVLDILTSLMDKSLALFEERGGEGRYRLLETIRQYGQERLAETEEAQTLHARHRDYFLALAEEAETHLTGAEQTTWLARLEAEHDNLQAALAWRGEEKEEGGLRLAGALWRFWDVCGYLSKGRTYLADALERAGACERTQARAKALNGGGALARSQGDFEAALPLHEESLAIFRELEDKQGIAASLNNLGLLASDRGDYETARTLYEESLTLRRELGDKRGIATALNNLGMVAYAQGDYEAARTLFGENLTISRELGYKGGIATALNNLGVVANNRGDYEAARALYEESLATRRELRDRQGIAMSLNNLGLMASARGDYEAAGTLFEESLAISRELGDRRGIALSLHNLGLAAHKQGNYGSARSLYEESLTLLRELGDRQEIADSLEAFASLAGAQRQSERTARLWGAAEALREEIGCPLPPDKREERERSLSAAQEALDESAFANAWAEGRTMSLEQALDYALEKTET